MRPVLFVVFVTFAVCVSAANLPAKRPKREMLAVTAMGDKIGRLEIMAKNVDSVIAILKPNCNVVSTENAKITELLNEVNENDEKLNPDIEDLFSGIEGVADEIDGKSIRLSSLTMEISKKFETEVCAMQTDMYNYFEQLKEKNVDVLSDENIEPFLNGILELLMKISSEYVF